VLALLALGLATLGRYTPSAVPAVTLANLLGGMAMVGVGAWLASRLRRRREGAVRASLRGWAWLAIALVVLQVASGAMISAQYAALACDDGFVCAARLWPPGDVLDAFDPWRELPPPADAASRADAARQAVLAAHRLLAVPTLLALVWVAARAAFAQRPGPARALLVLAAMQAGLGIGQSALGHPLALAVAHNVVAALVVVALGALLGRCGSGSRD
jgi:cytochrome c oxidase assembly protein subunit 15